jgi:hypothetical protein
MQLPTAHREVREASMEPECRLRHKTANSACLRNREIFKAVEINNNQANPVINKWLYVRVAAGK